MCRESLKPLLPSSSLISAQNADWLNVAEDDDRALFEHMTARDDAAAIDALRRIYEDAATSTADDRLLPVVAPAEDTAHLEVMPWIHEDTTLPPWSTDTTQSDIVAIYDGWQPPAPGTTAPIVLGPSPVIVTEVPPAGRNDAELLALYNLFDETKPHDGGEPQVLSRLNDGPALPHGTAADTLHLDVALAARPHV